MLLRNMRVPEMSFSPHLSRESDPTRKAQTTKETVQQEQGIAINVKNDFYSQSHGCRFTEDIH